MPNRPLACVRSAALAASLFLTLAVLPLSADVAPSSPDAMANLQRQLAAVEQQLASLQSQLSALQAKQSAMAAAPAPTPSAAPAAAAAPAPEAAAADSGPTYPLLNFHGFGDFEYDYSSNRNQFPNLFHVGEIDFYITSQISEQASILSENVISADSTFNNWNVEAERLLFDYRFNPYFNLVAGRFHTELGYYNTAYHHGTWFQLDTHRPWFLEFEDSGGILPVHMVGVSVDGDIPSSNLNLHYYVQVGNGRSYSPSTSPANPTQADEVAGGRKAVNVEITAKPAGLPGWKFGVGGYHDVVQPQDVTSALGQEGFDVALVNTPSAAETIGEAFATYIDGDWTFLTEAFEIDHKPTGGTDHRTTATYAELGRKFGAWTPYARYTYVNSPTSDPVYTLIQTAGLRYGPTLGLRFDFTDYACLKLQYEHNTEVNEQETAPIDDVAFQVGFTF